MKHGLLFVGMIGLVALAGPAFAQSPSQPKAIAHILKLAVAAMPSDFASLRGRKTHDGQFDEGYAVRDPNIPKGRIDHSLATPKHHEYWECFFVVLLPRSTTIDQASDIAAMTVGKLGPTPGYLIMGALDKSTGATIYTWRRSPTERVVATPFVQTANGTQQQDVGVAYSVRKDIVQNPHYVMFSRGLTPRDKLAMARAVAAEIHTGVLLAPTDFRTLRGNLIHAGNTHTRYKASLPDQLRYAQCEVDPALFSAENTAEDSHWTLTCTTPAVFNTPDMWNLMRTYVRNVLPAGWVERMNWRTNLAMFMSDKKARWDSPQGQMSVLLEENPDYDDGGMTYAISVIHFIPNGTRD
jgi:hypothetical protein